MRAAIRNVTLTTLVGLAAVASIQSASARSRHHHVVHHFVFATPQAARAVSDAGVFGSVFSTGILGASTADPYETRSVGYDAHGYYGPGFVYPDY